MCPDYRFIFMYIKLIFIWKVLHEDFFWKEEPGISYMAHWLGTNRPS